MKCGLSKCVFLVLTGFLFNGCSSTPNISMDKTKLPAIKTGDLLGISESRDFVIRNFSGLPALGGIVGGVVSGEGDASRSTKYVEAYNSGSVRLAVSLARDLQSELGAHDVQISYQPEAGARLKDGADDYSHIHTEKDVILSVWFGRVGYIANGAIDAPYEPWVVVNVRLLHGKTKQILSQKTYTAGYKARIDGAVFVACAKDTRFDTFEQLMANFSKSVDALSECERAIAKQAVEDLS